MKTDAQRIDHYNARMLSSNIDPVLTAVQAKAGVNFAAYETDFYPNQLALRGLLSAAGIMSVKFGAYEAFHGKLYHLSKVCTGPALVANVQALIDTWSDSAHLDTGAAVLLTEIANVIYHVFVGGTP